MTEFNDQLAIEDLTLEELRPVLVDALLAHVPFDGWTEAALERAAEDLGIPANRARLAFPEGAVDMVDAFSERADAAMTARLVALDVRSMNILVRIRLSVAVRLELADPHRVSGPRA